MAGSHSGEEPTQACGLSRNLAGVCVAQRCAWFCSGSHLPFGPLCCCLFAGYFDSLMSAGGHRGLCSLETSVWLLAAQVPDGQIQALFNIMRTPTALRLQLPVCGSPSAFLPQRHAFRAGVFFYDCGKYEGIFQSVLIVGI